MKRYGGRIASQKPMSTTTLDILGCQVRWWLQLSRAIHGFCDLIEGDRAELDVTSIADAPLTR